MLCVSLFMNSPFLSRLVGVCFAPWWHCTSFCSLSMFNKYWSNGYNMPAVFIRTRHLSRIPIHTHLFSYSSVWSLLCYVLFYWAWLSMYVCLYECARCFTITYNWALTLTIVFWRDMKHMLMVYIHIFVMVNTPTSSFYSATSICQLIFCFSSSWISRITNHKF